MALLQQSIAMLMYKRYRKGLDGKKINYRFK